MATCGPLLFFYCRWGGEKEMEREIGGEIARERFHLLLHVSRCLQWAGLVQAEAKGCEFNRVFHMSASDEATSAVFQSFCPQEAGARTQSRRETQSSQMVAWPDYPLCQGTQPPSQNSTTYPMFSSDFKCYQVYNINILFISLVTC